MHVEIQVALNFLISFLYNKLPRRRVNQFGEELEAALKTKFANHWYPNQPAKGSAYRCLKTANPLDPVFEIASRNCGLELSDVQEHLPAELSIWIDPGEVSYRMSEKSPVKLLCQKNELNGVATKRVQSQYNQLNLSKSSTSEQNFLLNEPIEGFMTNQNDNYSSNNTNEVSDLVGSGNGSPGNSSNHSSTSSSVDSGFNDNNGTNNDLNVRKFRSFNPEAQCFKPIESSNLLTSYNSQNSNQFSTNNLPSMSGYNFSLQQQQQIHQPQQQQQNSFSSVSSQFSLSQSNNGFTNTANNNTSYCFSNKSTLKQPSTSSTNTTAGFTKQNQTMTTAQFAQTKFGSTKLKTTTNNSNTGAICGINGTTKRNYTNRMSPTEFSNYIKQKAILQQQQQQQNANNASQSSNSHQLSVPVNSSNYGFSNLFNGLSPQQSRAISPISNQDNFLLMAAAAAAVSTNSNTNTASKSNLLNSNCNSIRNSLNLTANSTSPIATTNLPSLNSAGNSVCSSLNSNSGSLKLILNNNITSNNLSSPSSAPANDKLLSDINYLNELFNNTSLSPVMGNSSSIATTPSTNNSKQNRFNLNENFIDFNTNEYTNYANTEFNQQQNINKKVNNLKKTSVENLGLINQNDSKNITNESIIQQNANKPTNGNEENFDSFSLSNYPNQYQHLLVAN